jgi:hypothetical protein
MIVVYWLAWAGGILLFSCQSSLRVTATTMFITLTIVGGILGYVIFLMFPREILAQVKGENTVLNIQCRCLVNLTASPMLIFRSIR